MKISFRSRTNGLPDGLAMGCEQKREIQEWSSHGLMSFFQSGFLLETNCA